MGPYDVIVVGAGHAGCEAGLACARMGGRALILTINLDTVAVMACNPAIGGLAKGQLVREIDALGGEMGRVIDATGIQFRRLNTKKGPAVRSNRAQADKESYRVRMKEVLENEPGLEVRQGLVDGVWVEGDRLKGVITHLGERIPGRTVILTTGTFLRGLIHVGLVNYSAGRAGEPPAEGLSSSLSALGFELGRLKTGTTPRLDGKTIDFDKCTRQDGDDPPRPFSFDTEKIERDQVPCFLTRTTAETHEIIRGGLDRSPLYSGVITGTGPRYCPSIEDKVVKFPDRTEHVVFLEPEGLHTREVYPNGIPTSLPYDVQERMVESIPGLEEARIMRPGYAIEYDFVNPVQLKPTLMTRAVPGLFHAGQINGTSGYEEAAAQGIIAGINAIRFVRDEGSLVLDRSEAYIGVLIDDLVTKGTEEPYRMFTSRAEYRLLLREDNADLRLRETGFKAGLVSEEQYGRYLYKKERIEREIERLEAEYADPGPEIDRLLSERGSVPLREPQSLRQLLKRPEVDYGLLRDCCPPEEYLPPEVEEEVEITVKYEGYIQRERESVERFRKLEHERIPEGFEYGSVPGLSSEIREKLDRVRPESLGQALRIPGVTPAAVSLLQILVRSGPRRSGEV